MADAGAETLAGKQTEEGGAWAKPSLGQLWACLIAVGCCVLAWGFNLPAPQQGPAVGSWNYFVNRTDLHAARELWGINRTSSGKAVLEAAGNLAESFVPSAADEALAHFLRETLEASSTELGRIKVFAKHYAFWSLQRYLGWSHTDATALLPKKDFIASEKQISFMLMEAQQKDRKEQVSQSTVPNRGSSLAAETQRLHSSKFGVDHRHVYCLKASSLAWASFPEEYFQAEIERRACKVIAVLNLLDRCDDPLHLLDTAFQRLQPDGVLVIATTLPFEAFVFEGRFGSAWGKAHSRPPRSPLKPRWPRRPSPSFELSAASFTAALFSRYSGLELRSWTRLPYVSSGDIRRTHYVRDMAMFAFLVPATPQRLPQAEEMNDSATEGKAAWELPRMCSGKSPDAIYSWLSDRMAEESIGTWGEVLDAGGGFGSMCWLMRQTYRRVTEVTASKSGTYGFDAMSTAAASVDAGVEVVLGNWRDEEFLKGRSFDVVVADYLLGAIEYHWPYGADQMMDRLCAALRPGGYLLIVGMEPYEEVLDRQANWKDRTVLEIEALGDAAAALAGGTTYRELPERWILHQIRRRADFHVVTSNHFPMRLTAKSLTKQLTFARQQANSIANTGMQKAFLKRIDEMQQELKKIGSHHAARNYAIVIQRRDG